MGRYFFRGLMVIAPIIVTIALVHFVFVWVDSLLKPWVETPGVGFVIILTLVFVVGWVGSFLLADRLFGWFDAWLERLPGVNFVYSSVRDFFKAFVGNKRRFTHAVLVNVFAEDVWLVGFLTDEDLDEFQLGADFVSVYVPQAYNVAGQLYLVRRDRVRAVDHIAPGLAMKYAVTGGAVELSNGAGNGHGPAGEPRPVPPDRNGRVHA